MTSWLGPYPQDDGSVLWFSNTDGQTQQFTTRAGEKPPGYIDRPGDYGTTVGSQQDQAYEKALGITNSTTTPNRINGDFIEHYNPMIGQYERNLLDNGQPVSSKPPESTGFEKFLERAGPAVVLGGMGMGLGSALGGLGVASTAASGGDFALSDLIAGTQGPGWGGILDGGAGLTPSLPGSGYGTFGAPAQGGNMSFIEDFFSDPSSFNAGSFTPRPGSTGWDAFAQQYPDLASMGGSTTDYGIGKSLTSPLGYTPAPGSADWAQFAQEYPDMASMGGTATDFNSGAASLWQSILNDPIGAAKYGGNALLKSIMGEDGGGSSDGLLSRGLAAAPILAAINNAKNQTGADTGQLDSVYNQFNPSALAGQYDQNTADSRAVLAANLARRGVSGSSFGNADMTSFDTTRDLGRSQLIQGGLGTQAQIAGTSLNAKIASQKNQNDLYGRSLLALGSVFAPKSNSLLAGLWAS